MSYVHSFAPIVRADCKKIILGSMPGKASLQAQQYYAHPRNLFWHFMEVIIGIPKTLDYSQRCAKLLEHNVAVWDVLKTCTRSSSLDSDIIESSAIPNDFDALFNDNPMIEAVYFNGAKAHEIFEKRVVPTLGERAIKIQRTRLPSTSPANASIPLEIKLRAWRDVES